MTKSKELRQSMEKLFDVNPMTEAFDHNIFPGLPVME
jgi:hypothetical protein